MALLSKSPYSYILSGVFVEEDDLAAVQALGDATLVFEEKDAATEETYTTRTYTISFPSNIKQYQIKACLQKYLGPKYTVLHKKVGDWIKWVIHGSEPRFKFTFLETGTANNALKLFKGAPGFICMNFDNELDSKARTFTQTAIPTTGAITSRNRVTVTYNGKTASNTTTLAYDEDFLGRGTWLANDVTSKLGCSVRYQGATKFISNSYIAGSKITISGPDKDKVGFAYPLEVPAYPAMATSAEGAFPLTSDDAELIPLTEVTSAVLQDYTAVDFYTLCELTFSGPIRGVGYADRAFMLTYKDASGATKQGSLSWGFSVVDNKLYMNSTVRIGYDAQPPYSITYTPTSANYLWDIDGNVQLDAFTINAEPVPRGVQEQAGNLILPMSTTTLPTTGLKDQLSVIVNGETITSPVLTLPSGTASVSTWIDYFTTNWPELAEKCTLFVAGGLFTYSVQPNILGIKPKNGGTISPLISNHTQSTAWFIYFFRANAQLIVPDIIDAPIYFSTTVGKHFPRIDIGSAQSVTTFFYARATPGNLGTANASGNSGAVTAATTIDSFIQALNASNSQILFQKQESGFDSVYFITVTLKNNPVDLSVFNQFRSAANGGGYYPARYFSTDGRAVKVNVFTDINYPIVEKAIWSRGPGLRDIQIFYDRELVVQQYSQSIVQNNFSLKSVSGAAMYFTSVIENDVIDGKSVITLHTNTVYADETALLTINPTQYQNYIYAADAPYYIIPPVQNLLLKVEDPPILQKGSVTADTVRLQYDKELSTTLVPNAQNFVIDVTQ